MRNKNKLPLRNVLPKANDFSGLLGKGVSESEIIHEEEMQRLQDAINKASKARASSVPSRRDERFKEIEARFKEI